MNGRRWTCWPSSPSRRRPTWRARSTSAGYRWKAVGSAEDAARHEPADRLGRRGRRLRRRPRGRLGVLPGAAQARHAGRARCCVLVSGGQLADLELRDDLFDDFCLTPFHPVEVEARLRHLFWRGGAELRPEMVEYSGLALNLETYQATHRGPPARPHLHGVRAAQVPRPEPRQGVHPRDAARRGCGATSTTAGPARSTCTSAACGPSSARSTPT